MTRPLGRLSKLAWWTTVVVSVIGIPLSLLNAPKNRVFYLSYAVTFLLMFAGCTFSYFLLRSWSTSGKIQSVVVGVNSPFIRGLPILVGVLAICDVGLLIVLAQAVHMRALEHF